MEEIYNKEDAKIYKSNYTNKQILDVFKELYNKNNKTNNWVYFTINDINCAYFKYGDDVMIRIYINKDDYAFYNYCFNDGFTEYNEYEVYVHYLDIFTNNEEPNNKKLISEIESIIIDDIIKVNNKYGDMYNFYIINNKMYYIGNKREYFKLEEFNVDYFITLSYDEIIKMKDKGIIKEILI